MLKNKQVAKKIRAKRKQRTFTFTVSIPFYSKEPINSPYDLLVNTLKEPETDEYGLTGFQRFLAGRLFDNGESI